MEMPYSLQTPFFFERQLEPGTQVKHQLPEFKGNIYTISPVISHGFTSDFYGDYGVLSKWPSNGFLWIYPWITSDFYGSHVRSAGAMAASADFAYSYEPMPMLVPWQRYWRSTDMQISIIYSNTQKRWNRDFQWIGSRENLQETVDFSIKYGALL